MKTVNEYIAGLIAGAWLLVIKMMYEGCIKSCLTTLRLRILGNDKISGKAQNFIEW